MATTRIGINGFGRMGRLALRSAWGSPDLAIAHVNERAGNAETSAHLLTFDSVHGRWSHAVEGTKDVLVIDGARVGHSSVADPGAVPWRELGIDIVLECTGRFRTR